MADDSGISWSVDTHEHRDHSTDWYWGLGLLAIAGAGLALFFGNLLFAVIIVMAAGSIGVLALRGPPARAGGGSHPGPPPGGAPSPPRAAPTLLFEKERRERGRRRKKAPRPAPAMAKSPSPQYQSVLWS